MSRFFGGSDSDSESTSSEEEQAPQRITTNLFAQSDDEDDVKRVVKSHKDKRLGYDCDCLLHAFNFELLGKIYQKAKNIIDKTGIPKFYVKYLVELEDYIKEIWDDKDTKKKLSKINAKALGALRQKMKKYVRDFENDMAAYRENPDVDEDSNVSGEEEDESDEDMDDGDVMDFTKKPENTTGRSQFLKSGSSESESDGDDWSASEDEDDGSDKEGGGGSKATGPSIFLKSTAGTVARDSKRRKGKGSKQVAPKDDNELSAEEAKVSKDKSPDKALFGKDAEITNESVLVKVQEIVAVRGKKSTDRREVINTFKELLQITSRENLSTALSVKILVGLISAIYDSAVAVLVNSMKQEYWKMCTEFIVTLVDMLLDHPEITTGMNIPEESENIIDPNLPYQVRGCVVTLVERMDDEFTKILQSCDAHSLEYVQRLKDESIVTAIIKRTQKLVEKNNFPASDTCKVYLRRIEHMYYKYDTLLAKTTSKSENNDDDEEKNEPKEEEEGTNNSKEEMARLCNYIYKRDQTERIRTRAMLCQTYHHAIHDRWTDARDLMLMSHLQESIQFSDIPTQVLYNRTMVQLGLCAFRHGIIKNAHNCLVELQVTNRVRELLAQGFSQRQSDKTKDQEKLERQRQIPFHMHINTELIECCYLTSAMLLEIPYMAAHEYNRRRLISKNFHFQLRNSERQTLVGPPENMREQVIAAAHAMRTGDWKACSDYILRIKVWDLFTEPETVKAMLLKKIREESLRTYLFTYGGVYSSLSLSSLSEMFGMESSDVYRTISKMIMNDELQASWDEPTETLMMHKCEPTKLQNLAIQIADKIYALADTNEKILHERHGYQINKVIVSDWREQSRDRRRVQQSQNDENWSGNKGNQGRSGKGSGNRNKRKHGGK
ncbi:Eukaryotic translation initiation factor 3 subunit C [Trichoplax sp. H2]|nr:Eukaryotic translation initiation factor 3 subunit C [Trichoplax sp. H2]|eukprot:RDD44309.1 Eukaryotic translation initiation factor 3 subunit C [Trichoplax sp. H2]